MNSLKNEAIRKRAHEIWEQQGRPEGQHEDHWRAAEQELADGGDQQNQGEGNKSAALAFDRNQEEFAREADVDGLGRDAREALAGSEGVALQKAEKEGRARSRGEDPALSTKSVPPNRASRKADV